MASEKFKIAGISFYHDSIMKNLAYEDYDYSRPQKELIEFYYPDDYLYKYHFDNSNVSLVPEPNNPHDPKAIRVEVNGTQIGYIKKGSCSHVRNLLNSPDFERMEIKIGGGEYKHLWEDEDEKIQIEKGTKELSAVLIIYTHQEAEQPKPIQSKPINPQPVQRQENLVTKLFNIFKR